MNPKFRHDCTACRYVGQFFLKDGLFPGHYDVYECGRDLPTVVARYGDDGHEYYSGDLGHAGALVPLVVAATMVQNEGVHRIPFLQQ